MRCLRYSTTRREISQLANKLQFTCEELSNENRELKKNTNNLDNYSRQSNVVIRGLTEPQGE